MPFGTFGAESDHERLCIAVSVLMGLFAFGRALAILRGRFEPRAMRAALDRRAISVCPTTREALGHTAHRSITGCARLLPLVALAHVLAVHLASFSVSMVEYDGWGTLNRRAYRLLRLWLESGPGFTTSLLVFCWGLLVYAVVSFIADAVLAARGHRRFTWMTVHDARETWEPSLRVACAFSAAMLVLLVMLLPPTKLDGEVGALSLDTSPCIAEDLELAIGGRDTFIPVGAESERRVLAEGYVVRRGVSVCVHVPDGLSHGEVTRAIDALAGRGAETVRIAEP